MSVYTILWLLWGLAFALIEGMALFNSKPGDTLSEHVWAYMGIGEGRRRSGWTQLRRVSVIALLAWLAVHFLTGGWA